MLEKESRSVAPWTTAFPRWKPPLPKPPPRGLLGRIRGWLEAFRQSLADSAWSGLAMRVFAFSVVVFVLAWIGGRTARGATPASPFATSLAPDAGADEASPSSRMPPPPFASVPPFPTSFAAAPPRELPPPATTAVSGHTRASTDDPVYLNHANADELRRLPGVGVKRADAILALRGRLGHFQRVEDLLRVKGVGRGTIRKWRPLLRLDSPSPPPVSAPDGGA